jgi:hypothetical protein
MFINDARVIRVEAEQSGPAAGHVELDVTFTFTVPAEEATSFVAALSSEAEPQTLEIGNLPASLLDC